MAAPMASRFNMLMPARIGRFFQHGSFQNVLCTMTKQLSLIGVTSKHGLCTQNPSDGPKAEQEKGVPGDGKSTSESRYAQSFNPELVRKLTSKMEGDMPVENMPDPFEKKYRRCLLCEKNIDLDWKNVRLLSQFVSPFTGRIYGRHMTGLCIPMQKKVARLIKRARILGYMAYINKDPHYLTDPRLFDPFRPPQK